MVTFQVNDMTCGHCVNSITEAVRSLDPDAKVKIDLARHQVEIESNQTEAGKLAKVIKEAGYTPIAMTSTLIAPTTTAPRAGCCCR